MNTLPRNPSIPTTTPEAGFALPAAIFALVVVAFLVTSGIHMANQESRIGKSTETGTQAFYVAETGLNTAMANWAPGAANLEVWGPPDLIEGTTSQGEWRVLATRVDTLVYLFQATGAVGSAGGRQAQRSLGQVGRLTTLNFEPSGALTMSGGINSTGAPKKVDGADEDPAGWGDMCDDSQEDLPGIFTDAPGDVDASPGGPSGNGCGQQYRGDPCIEDGSGGEVEEQLANMDAIFDEFVDLATNHLTAGNWAPGPDLVQDANDVWQCNVAENLNWGDPLRYDSDPDDGTRYPCATHFPLIHATGNVSLVGSGDASRPSSGQGILMVDGNLSLSGDFTFHGILLVRGTFEVASGSPTVRGTVLAHSVGTFGGTPNILYSSCAVTQALTRNTATRLRALNERSWVDLTGISF